MFGTNKSMLVGCTDADIVEDVDSRKSTFGYLITFSRRIVSWQSRLQKYVALSTIKVEYIVIIEASNELLWMKMFLQELGLQQKKSIYSTVIVKVLFISVRIQLFTLNPSILM